MHDINIVVPFIGTTGLFLLRDPYNQLIDNNIEYTVISVVSLSGSVSLGKSPKDEVYLFNGDTEENYNTDLSVNNYLLTIQAGNGDLIEIPNSSLISQPIANGIKYYSGVLCTTLSILPEHVSLDSIMSEITDVVYKHLGVASESTLSLVGGSILISQEKHDLIETTRLANIESKYSSSINSVDLLRINSDLMRKVTMLENYIKSKAL
jgi:hypothetical protein